jgi:hypothetical protein
MTQVRMRKDLAEEGIKIPAGMAYRDYDDLMYVEYFSAEDLEGAVEYDNGENPDNHPFTPVILKNGRWFYFIGMDLDWIYDEE